jgi:hypothetical protein
VILEGKTIKTTKPGKLANLIVEAKVARITSGAVIIKVVDAI